MNALPPDLDAAIIERLRAGWLVKDIVAKLGVSIGAVQARRNVLVAAGEVRGKRRVLNDASGNR